MKTIISITGQVNGNSTLKHAIQDFDCVIEKHFSNFTIEFPTKGAAVQALSNAFQSLKSDEPEYYRNGSIYYSRGSFLSYDASTAKIC